jgi:hypothetical protein
MSYDLSEKFNDFKIPKEVLEQVKMDLITMPKNMLKTMLFASENNLINENIDYWMSIKPHRQSDESMLAYKARQKFQSALIKYRPYIYNYSENVELL